MNKHQNYAAFDNNPYITASRKAALIVHVSVTVLLGIGSDERQHNFDVCSQKLL